MQIHSSTDLTLAVEPSDADEAVYSLVSRARRSIDMTMYELNDPAFESHLVGAARRGITVRVLLDRAFEGGRANERAYALLVSAGVPVRWAPPSVLFHQKTITVDDEVSAIMTGNLVADEVPTTRDFVVLDHQPSAVAAVESVFEKDWDGDPVVAGAASGGLVWSPGAECALLTLIGSARRTLLMETEEMDSSVIESAIEAAARRGVVVRIVMTADPTWDGALGRLADAGVHVGTTPDAGGRLYLHAKAVVADDEVAFVGSQNLSTASLEFNRELGIITTQQSVIGPVTAAITSDLAAATRASFGS